MQGIGQGGLCYLYLFSISNKSDNIYQKYHYYQHYQLYQDKLKSDIVVSKSAREGADTKYC